MYTVHCKVVPFPISIGCYWGWQVVDCDGTGGTLFCAVLHCTDKTGTLVDCFGGTDTIYYFVGADKGLW